MNLFNRKANLNSKGLMINIGTRYDGEPVLVPWPYMPHTLIAGITGSGKSSWTATMIGEIAGHHNTAICGRNRWPPQHRNLWYRP